MATQTENHMSIGRRLMTHADDQFNSGDFLQASEKAWGAVAHFLKAHGVSRGMSHSSHYELRRVANHLENEADNDRIGELFSICESIHANYYEAWMSEDELERRMGNAKELITLLEETELSSTVEPLANQTNHRERQFFVTRDGSI